MHERIKDLLKQNRSLSIHQINLQILVIENFKTQKGLNPVIMGIFILKNLIYNFPNVATLIETEFC